MQTLAFSPTPEMVEALFRAVFEPRPTPAMIEAVRAVVREELAAAAPPQPQLPEWLTRRETADTLRVSLVTLNQWSKDGVLAAHRVRSRVRYRRDEVLAVLKQVHTLKHSRR